MVGCGGSLIKKSIIMLFDSANFALQIFRHGVADEIGTSHKIRTYFKCTPLLLSMPLEIKDREGNPETRKIRCAPSNRQFCVIAV
jgi:hypothetical protein